MLVIFNEKGNVLEQGPGPYLLGFLEKTNKKTILRH
jgi:hypothetical protein